MKRGVTWNLAAVLLAAAALVLGGRPPARSAGSLEASGMFEAREVRVMTEVPGRVVRLLVNEGETVRAGQVVAELDPGPLPDQVHEAEAALEAARAQLADLEAQPLPTTVAVARARVRQAEAQVQTARRQLELQQQVYEHPVDLETRIRLAEAQLPLLERQLASARAARKRAVVMRDRFQNDYSLQGRTQYTAWQKQVEAAEATMRATEAEIEGTRRLLGVLRAIRANPLALAAQLHRAEGALRAAQAQLKVAEAELALAAAPARQEELEMARARVAQAEAQLELLRTRLDRYTVRAPADGVVAERLVEPGEAVQAGQALAIVSNITTLDLVVFVPEPALGAVYLGQRVTITVDAFPDRTFSGRVVWIADEAEFTPKNVQTKEDRQETVFRVRVRVPNPDGVLKAGMPADAQFEP